MKKLLLVLAACGCAGFAQADNMSFVTVLSNSVGSFNKLETADPTVASNAATVNFCTQVGTSGAVELKGTKHANLNKITLSNNTTAGRTDGGKYSLSGVTLNNGGRIKGGNLLGNTLTVNNAASGKGTNVYGSTLTAQAAKTKTLNVGSGKSVMSGTGSAEQMVWSNEYQSDTACTNAATCAKQYLLKSKGSSSGPLRPFEPIEEEEIEYEYYWEWTNTGASPLVGVNLACIQTCVSTLDNAEIIDHPKPIPLTKSADAFGRTCNADSVNYVCKGQAVNGTKGDAVYAGTAGQKYCVEYTCKRRAK